MCVPVLKHVGLICVLDGSDIIQESVHAIRSWTQVGFFDGEDSRVAAIILDGNVVNVNVNGCRS